MLERRGPRPAALAAVVDRELHARRPRLPRQPRCRRPRHRADAGGRAPRRRPDRADDPRRTRGRRDGGHGIGHGGPQRERPVRRPAGGDPDRRGLAGGRGRYRAGGAGAWRRRRARRPSVLEIGSPESRRAGAGERPPVSGHHHGAARPDRASRSWTACSMESYLARRGIGGDGAPEPERAGGAPRPGRSSRARSRCATCDAGRRRGSISTRPWPIRYTAVPRPRRPRGARRWTPPAAGSSPTAARRSTPSSTPPAVAARPTAPRCFARPTGRTCARSPDVADDGTAYCSISPRFRWHEEWTGEALRATLQRTLPALAAPAARSTAVPT